MWRKYRIKNYNVVFEMRPYVLGEDLEGINLDPDYSPVPGDMVARFPIRPDDMWIIADSERDVFIPVEDEDVGEGTIAFKRYEQADG
jgi:hypothetical protein